MLITLIAWLACGALLGWIATMVVDLHGDDPRLGIALAALAGVAGGLLYVFISGTPARIDNAWSFACVALGALGALGVWHVVRSRRQHDKPTVRRSY